MLPCLQNLAMYAPSTPLVLSLWNKKMQRKCTEQKPEHSSKHYNILWCTYVCYIYLYINICTYVFQMPFLLVATICLFFCTFCSCCAAFEDCHKLKVARCCHTKWFSTRTFSAWHDVSSSPLFILNYFFYFFFPDIELHSSCGDGAFVRNDNNSDICKYKLLRYFSWATRTRYITPTQTE